MEEDRGVLESYQPCQEDEIRSCNRIEVDFNIIDQSNRLKVFCTSVESKFDASESAMVCTLHGEYCQRVLSVCQLECLSRERRWLPTRVKKLI